MGGGGVGMHHTTSIVDSIENSHIYIYMTLTVLRNNEVIMGTIDSVKVSEWFQTTLYT